MKRTKHLFWLCASSTLVNAIISAGFSLASLSGPGPAQTVALYSASRSVTLALMTVLVIGLRSYSGLLILAVTMTLIQAADALIGNSNHDTMKTVGPAGLAILTGITSLLLLRSVGLSAFKTQPSEKR